MEDLNERDRSGQSALTEVLLGLKPATATDIREFETRFDIELPIKRIKTEAAEIRIEPQPIDDCQIVVREPGATKPSRVVGKLIVPPLPIPGEEFGFRVQTPLFDFVFRRQNFELHPNSNFKNVRESPGTWLNHSRMILSRVKDDTVIQIVPNNRPGQLEMTINAVQLDVGPYARMERLCSNIIGITEAAGITHLSLCIRELLESRPGVQKAVQAMKIGSVFRFNMGPTDPLPPSSRFVFCKCFRIGECLLGYSTVVEGSPRIYEGVLKWECKVVSLGTIERIKNEGDEYDHFVERSAAAAGLSNRIVWKPAESSTIS